MRIHQAFVNTAETVVLLAALGGALIGIGAWPGSTGAVIGLAVGMALIAGSYWFSDRIALQAAGARRVTEAEAPNLDRIVRSLTTVADTPMPSIHISPATQPNAFATGRNPAHAAVCVTEGLLPLLDDDELEGVLAHELSHVADRDILIGSIAAALAMALALVARFALGGTHPDAGRRFPCDRRHREPAHGSQGGVRRSVPHPPVGRRAHRPPERDDGWKCSANADGIAIQRDDAPCRWAPSALQRLGRGAWTCADVSALRLWPVWRDRNRNQILRGTT